MRLLIKGMVCNRCVYVLEQEFTTLGIDILDVKLGQVVIKKPKDFSDKMNAIQIMLRGYGFELMYDKNQKTIIKIKELVEKGISMQLETATPTKFTILIGNEMHKNYDTLSGLFSSVEGITLEKYIISRKIEKVKELLIYTDQSLSEIAYTLGYSSGAHLSHQLKKYTGFTSSYYKTIRRNKNGSYP
ncbi:helix-turn-helix domain-containing protein [Sphingobacterium cellulitidis]|uniref:helix-turn-helix domain-containing protein n=1 Tax=Sphingobacterium cellulitidis TaxID=1768011 RepID=UPI000B93AC65|nr:AraC family transcriptional regulator [Sphingobacterium cellulitidis]